MYHFRKYCHPFEWLELPFQNSIVTRSKRLTLAIRFKTIANVSNGFSQFVQQNTRRYSCTKKNHQPFQKIIQPTAQLLSWSMFSNAINVKLIFNKPRSLTVRYNCLPDIKEKKPSSRQRTILLQRRKNLAKNLGRNPFQRLKSIMKFGFSNNKLLFWQSCCKVVLFSR